jgi:hypothetical protein
MKHPEKCYGRSAILNGASMIRRACVLVACALALMPSNNAAGRTAQDHTPDRDLQVAGPLVGGRQLAVKPFSTLPKGVLYLRFENFPTTDVAQRTATPASAVVEWAGKVWLITLGPRGQRSSRGTFVAEIGPVPPVPRAASYVLDVNEADFGADMKAQVARQVHTHPGPEIFYLLTGEQCLETPKGTMRARAGEGMVAPADTPMQLNIVGSTRRDAFFVVVHDFAKPRMTLSDWHPTGACDK